ncbi:cysteine-rich receptor-like protein kinase 42 [Ziziphus jujuba]|uniref:Cysteine-rich receptor-like protein kinase 42 n=1 Tax=Ziziphus jujuba TaxID=326968 RepID=A0A6P3ZKB3_ZIZJJ|nr:cysteine-rich receptor-like protein kinase 42 [Ziziphus jujuba]
MINPMHTSISHNKSVFFFFFVIIFFLFSFFSPTVSDPRISIAGMYCGRARAPAKANFIPTFVKEMESLSQTITDQQWGTHFVNTTIPIYGLAQCFQDLSRTDCLLCYAASRTKLPRCLPSISARIYLDGCFLRYDNYSFYKETTDTSRDTVNCSSKYAVLDDQSGKSQFVKNVKFVVNNVTSIALKNGGFGVAEVKGVYALAQCWKTVGYVGCRACLEKAAEAVGKCAPKREARALYAGCYLRYSTDKFYNDKQASRDSDRILGNTGLIVAIVLTGTAFIMLSLFAAYAAYAKLSNTKGRGNLGKVASSMNKSSLNFKYETLEKATDYFNPSRKIGQGGAGSVFKGNLPNGETVAVKRLVFNTRQWVDEFFNEVNLISVIQHKNLVKLLGCSIEGPESLLVYEYVPKKSLDQFLFEKDKVQILIWKQRVNIIVGIAEGLAYLHGGCKVRIIHRDIKSSNILLDENLNPKIADFGLVRCFSADKTHLSTGIAGTLGYMAPEYLIRGQLTEKADVYSFGVLVLEIVCGRRNSAFKQDSGSLLQMVWKHYKSNELAEAVDPCLGNDFPANEASKVLQIGLLCTQASVSLRPSMAEVVTLLTNKEGDTPIPNQPPFLNASVLEPSSSVRSYSTHSLASNAFTKFEASSCSTELSSARSSNGIVRSGMSQIISFTDGPSRSEESTK